MKRLVLTPILLALLALPATAWAATCVYTTQSKAGRATTSRSASGSCTAQSGVASLADSDLQLSCVTPLGGAGATWKFALSCPISSAPSVHVSYGTKTAGPTLSLTRLSSSSYTVTLRLSDPGVAVVHRVSIGYYC